MNKRSRAGRGFTMPEVLVAIGVIMVLVALLRPVFVGSTRKAGQIRNLAHMNSLQAAMGIYLGESDDVYPHQDHAKAFDNAAEWYKPLIRAGVLSDDDEVDEFGLREAGVIRFAMSGTLALPPDYFVPEQTRHWADEPGQPVGAWRVRSPSHKGSIWQWAIEHEGPNSVGDPWDFWCCTRGDMAGAVGFADGHSELRRAADFVFDPLYSNETGIGKPVNTTWNGVEGVDRKHPGVGG